VASTALLLLRLLPPPPSPPPFPYTTLFRSPSESGQDLSVEIVAVVEPMQFLTGATLDTEDFTTAFPEIVEDDHLFVRAAQDADRSEEHTSELQSRFDLVCRLLLEKKKDTDL